MQLGFVLFYVSAVLILNGIWMLGRIADREIVAINLVTACVSGGTVIHDAFGGGGGGPCLGPQATLSLLFATIYLWVAHNRLTGMNERGWAGSAWSSP